MAAEKVLAAGKHLFLEKPVARDAHECQHVFDAASVAFKASGARFFAAENSSFWPEVYRAKQLVREGAIGEVITARSHYYESLDDTPMNPGGGGGGEAVETSPAAEGSETTEANASYERADTGWLGWRSSLERSGGGVVLDGGQHWIRPLREFFGEEVKSVVAVTGRPLQVLEGESMSHAILEFHSGKHASFQATVLGAGSAMTTREPCFRVLGSAGEIVIVGGFGAGGYILKSGGEEEPLLSAEAPGGFLSSFGPQMTDFAQSILQDKPFHRAPEYAMGDLLVAKAIYKSASSRAWEPVWDEKTSHFKQTF
eukprot:gene20755-32326_t